MIERPSPGQLSVSFLLFCLLIGTWHTFAPGLTGPFFFDDFVHLPSLAGNGDGINSWEEVLRLVFPAHGGTGRSLSYASLLIDDYAWPTDPYTFKRTNLLIHLLNTVLVFVLARSIAGYLARTDSGTERANWIGLTAAALWAIHPLHLSPVMMVIQRMTLIAGTFTLLALITYLKARKIAPTRPRASLLLAFPVFAFLVALGLLGKETAFLTMIYVAVLEATLLGGLRQARPSWWKPWSLLFVAAPLALIATYFVIVAQTHADAYASREFDLTQRLLTQGRVVVTYLRVILLPSISQSGPFRDDFEVSTDLLHPATTLPAILALLALGGLALALRKRWPLFAFPVLWFFAGHSLESTAIPLELYFEHRNSMPMLGFYIALGLAVFRTPKALTLIARAALVAYFAMALLITLSAARVWGHVGAMANIWATERPGSTRAQMLAVNHWLQSQDGPRLLVQLDAAEEHDPNNVAYQVIRLSLEACGHVDPGDLNASVTRTLQQIPRARFEFASLEMLRWMLRPGKWETCTMPTSDLKLLVQAFLANPKFSGRVDVRRALHLVLVEVAKKDGDLDSAITNIRHAYEAVPFFGTALDEATLLLSAGLFDEAERAVDKAAATPYGDVFDYLVRDQQVEDMREGIRKVRAATEALAGDSQHPKGQQEP